MTERGEAALPGRITIRAGGRKVVLTKHVWESERHVLLKALVFGLYMERYPGLTVEPRSDHRYRPDLVALDEQGEPRFWAECGETGRDKLSALVHAFPTTHLVLAKQVATLAPYEALASAALAGTRRTAPVDLLNLPSDAARFVGEHGRVAISFADVTLVRLGASPDREEATAAAAGVVDSSRPRRRRRGRP